MNNSKTIAIVFGTRPEFIKLKELIYLACTSSIRNSIVVVNTGQHTDLLDNHIDVSGIKVDENLEVERLNGNLSVLAAESLLAFGRLYEKYPNLEFLIGQGDTNTVLSLSIFCYLERLKFVHVEAGLRTNDIYNPYPEEFNRIIGTISAYFHFAPTKDAYQNLINEGVDTSKILISGNTIIDALIKTFEPQKSGVSSKRLYAKSVLVTIHRREMDFAQVISLARKLNKLILNNELTNVSWIVHPNYSQCLLYDLNRFEGMDFIQPLGFIDFVNFYQNVDLVITDSGGVTEEAITCGIRTIVFRKKSERFVPLSVKDRVLVSLDLDHISNFISEGYHIQREISSYFGDGLASRRILNWIESQV